MSATQEIGVYLVQALSSLLLILIVLRGVLHAVRADFYNPVTQFVVKVTNPIIAPLRKLIPFSGRIDPATVLLALVVQALGIALVLWFSGFMPPNPLLLLAWSAVGVISLLVNLYFIALIAMIVVSWVAPGSHNPAIYLLYQITEPVMAPVRSLLPNMGGIDFSPILLFILINVVQIALRHMAVSIGLPASLVIGL
ncbi:MAG: YggT family protein [Halieaceae bacterium]|jgi:YggT family protein|nr:YggT family protein [Halieaceae bacterium]